MTRTPEQWRMYVDALIEDMNDINGLYKAAIISLAEAHEREYALIAERDGLADQCADLESRVAELAKKLERANKDNLELVQRLTKGGDVK